MDDVRPPYRQEHRHEAVNRHQPAPQHHESPAPATPETPKKHKKSRKKPIITTILVLLVLIGIGAGDWLYMKASTSPIPKNVRQSVGFPLYYPSQVPSGYHLDKSSIKSAGGLVSYRLQDSSGVKPIAVTEQATPNNFNVSKIIGISSAPVSTTPAGNSYNLSAGQHAEYMIVTGGETLIFVSSPTKLPISVINPLISSLQPL